VHPHTTPYHSGTGLDGSVAWVCTELACTVTGHSKGISVEHSQQNINNY